jgi:hypothetical protein
MLQWYCNVVENRSAYYSNPRGRIRAVVGRRGDGGGIEGQAAVSDIPSYLCYDLIEAGKRLALRVVCSRSGSACARNWGDAGFSVN